MGRHRRQLPERSSQVNLHLEQYSGPLPKPEDFAKYEAALPGAAERILTQFEHQSAHRRGLESKVVDSNVVNERRGVLSATWLMTLFVGGGVVLLALGRETAGYWTVGYGALQTTLSFLVNVIGRARAKAPSQPKQ